MKSSFACPPVRLSIPTKWVVAFSVPAPAPVRTQAFVRSGPASVSRPVPPSIWPLTESRVWTWKRSLEVPPVRFSIAVKASVLLSVPASAALTLHALDASGPISVSLPSPPSICPVTVLPVTVTVSFPAAPATTSWPANVPRSPIVSVSSPAPRLIVSEVVGAVNVVSSNVGEPDAERSLSCPAPTLSSTASSAPAVRVKVAVEGGVPESTRTGSRPA